MEGTTASTPWYWIHQSQNTARKEKVQGHTAVIHGVADTGNKGTKVEGTQWANASWSLPVVPNMGGWHLSPSGSPWPMDARAFF